MLRSLLRSIPPVHRSPGAEKKRPALPHTTQYTGCPVPFQHTRRHRVHWAPFHCIRSSSARIVCSPPAAYSCPPLHGSRKAMLTHRGVAYIFLLPCGGGATCAAIPPFSCCAASTALRQYIKVSQRLVCSGLRPASAHSRNGVARWWRKVCGAMVSGRV